VAVQTTVKRDLEKQKIQLEVLQLVLRILFLLVLGAVFISGHIPADELLGLV
jgi:hypothetical protein